MKFYKQTSAYVARSLQSFCALRQIGAKWRRKPFPIRDHLAPEPHFLLFFGAFLVRALHPWPLGRSNRSAARILILDDLDLLL